MIGSQKELVRVFLGSQSPIECESGGGLVGVGKEAKMSRETLKTRTHFRRD